MNPTIEAWQEWKNKGLYPYAGGWGSQPLSILASIRAIDLVYNTVTYMDSEGSNWATLSPTQADIMRQLVN